MTNNNSFAFRVDRAFAEGLEELRTTQEKQKKLRKNNRERKNAGKNWDGLSKTPSPSGEENSNG